MLRRRLMLEADRRGARVELGAVRLGYFAVELRDVTVRPSVGEAFEAQLPLVRLEFEGAPKLTAIRIVGGTVRLRGEAGVVRESVRSLLGPSGREHPGASSTNPLRGWKLVAEKLDFSLNLATGETVHASGVGGVRESGKTSLSFAAFAGAANGHAVSISNGDVVVGPDFALQFARAEALEFSQVLQSSKADEIPGEVARNGATDWPDPARMFHPVLVTSKRFAAHVAPDAQMTVDALSFSRTVRTETLRFGPGPLSVARKQDRVILTFTAVEDSRLNNGTTPLSLEADVPLEGDTIRMRLSGGPVSLAAMGVHEGTKGLFDVSRARVSGKGSLEYAADSETLGFDGELQLRSVSVKDDRLAPLALTNIDAGLRARGQLLRKGELRVKDAQIELGALRAHVQATVATVPDHLKLETKIDVPAVDCQAILDSAPKGLFPVIAAARVSGTFRGHLELSVDTRELRHLGLDYHFDDSCRFIDVPQHLLRERFSRAFTYQTYDPDGGTHETTTGPDTDAWASIEDISPFMVSAVLTTEDGAFFRHKGFNHAAIRASVMANFKARRFVRGASTITMQLAKNLFLFREKALSRKLEEIVLTDYLENAFTKTDLMELYLNVVEFGPNVYGIKQAAEHYFARTPAELNVIECFFLASLLPSPIRRGKLREAGTLSEGWASHVHGLMRAAAAHGKISHAELDEGLATKVVFALPGMPRPDRRPPAAQRRYERRADDTLPLD
jgi:hypothetical protein